MPIRKNKEWNCLKQLNFDSTNLVNEKSERDILKNSTDYSFIPTTVFSPTEYSFVGLNE